MPKKCNNCSAKKHCQDSFVSWIFFLVGILATVAIRLVTVLPANHPVYGKIAWYIGVVGFFIFFVYKFKVDSARGNLIRQAKLIEKLGDKAELKDEDYQLVSSILCSLSSNKDLINYFVIFATSIVAFVIALYIDIFGK
jgi:hypothetical protein